MTQTTVEVQAQVIGVQRVAISPMAPAVLLAKGNTFYSPLIDEKLPVGTNIVCRFRLTAHQRRLEGYRIAENKPAAETTSQFPEIYVPPSIRQAFDLATRLAGKRRFYGILMTGPSGYGKTTLPLHLAKEADRKSIRVDCSKIRDTEEWFGYRELRSGETRFELNGFSRLIQDSRVTVVLDEVNRLEPWLSNSLFSLLDSGTVSVHGYNFSVGTDILFVGTLNEGYRYVGTFELDEALRNRFPMTIEVGPLDRDVETQILHRRTGLQLEKCDTILSVFSSLRSTGNVMADLSTRVSLAVADMMSEGVSLRDAFQLSLISRTDAVTRKNIMDAVSYEEGKVEERLRRGAI